MSKRLIRFSIVMVLVFMLDSVLAYFLPYDFTKSLPIVIPYISLITFTLLNNAIDDANRYWFALICGLYYTIIYADSNYVCLILFFVYAFIGKHYMKRSTFTFYEGFFIAISTICFHEIILYLLVWMNNTTNMTFIDYSLLRLLPTIIFNAFAFIPVFFIHNKVKYEGDVDVYFDKDY